MNQNKIHRLIFVLFFLSGACSLIYQIVWTRMMMLVFGVTVYAVSAVLCSFMAGLALGNFTFGRLAARLKRPLFTFGLMEIGIGVFALLFPLIMKGVEPLFVGIHHLFYDVNYYLFSFIRFLIILPILLIPTTLMGGNLPVIVQYLAFLRRNKELDSDAIGRDIGVLYAVNTFGAVCGTFLIGFLMLAYLGMTVSTIIAAALNLGLGGAAMFLGSKFPMQFAESEGAQAPQSEPSPSQSESTIPVAENTVEKPRAKAGKERRDKSGKAKPAKTTDKVHENKSKAAVHSPGALVSSRTVLLWAVGVSGFASLALEVLWTRVLVAYIKNSTYAFSSILLVFLIGLAAGSWLFSLILPRIRRHFLFFALLEAGIGIWTICSFYVVDKLQPVTEYLTAHLPTNNWLVILFVILAQTFLILFVPTLLMGMTLPLATHMLTNKSEEAGRSIGNIFGFNTLGTVVGSFAAGFILIPWMGVRSAFIFTAAVNMVIAAALVLSAPRMNSVFKWAFALGCLVLVMVMPAMVRGDVLKDFFEKRLGKILFYREDVTDTVMVIEPYDNNGRPMKDYRDVVFADGRANGGHRTRVEDHFYAHLPMLVHKNPENVLSIGVCSGNTVGAIGLHQRMKHLDAVELSAGVIEATKFIETNYGIFNNGDKRVKLHIEDGRNFLLGSKDKYDVININPPYVHTAGVIFLYTREFLTLCRTHLKPGGLTSHFLEPDKLTETDLKSLVATFASVFPHVAIWNGPEFYSWNLVGSESPITVPLANVRAVLNNEPTLRKAMEEDRMADPLLMFSLYLMGEDKIREFSEGGRIVSDDKTRIDFTSPKSQFSGFGFYYVVRGLQKLQIKQDDYADWMKGGWATLNRMVDQSVSVEKIVDWTGIPEDQRANDTRVFQENLDMRKRVFLREYGITIAIE